MFLMFLSSVLARSSDGVTKHLETCSRLMIKTRLMNQSERHSFSVVMADLDFARALMEQVSIYFKFMAVCYYQRRFKGCCYYKEKVWGNHQDVKY